ncbi:MAG: TPM domain-containing protein [Chloroflexota bacterium]
MHRSRAFLGALVAGAWLAVVGIGPVAAASPSPPAPAAIESPGSTPPPPGPPFPEPIDGQAVYDYAGVLSPETEVQAEQIVDAIEAQTKAEIAVYTQALGRDDITTAEAEVHAAALMDEWGVGRAGIDDGLVILFDLDTSLAHGQVQLYPGAGFAEKYLSQDGLQAIYESDMLPQLSGGDLDSALLLGLAQIVSATLDASPPPGKDVGTTGVPPGPPFPAPETDRAVYDYAGLFDADTIVKAEATIDAIETRTGAEVVVYSQDSGGFPTTDETAAKARALIDQWGIGRAGFDDGMVIFFDMQTNLEHGQVQLYAAPGFEAAYLSNGERQAIYENEMLPDLISGDFNGALTTALAKVDAAATPEHAASLQTARQVNAAIGLVGAPIVLLGLSGWAFLNWRRFGKDPVYLDDPSVHLPAPPPDLTAASGAMIMDGGTSRRALTTAMLDLASRGLIAFREDPGGLLAGRKVGIDINPARGDAEIEAQRARNARRPIGPAEELALGRLTSLGSDGAFISPEELPKFGSEVSDFDRALEEHVVGNGWFAEKPSKVVARWTGRGILAIIAGVIAFVAGLNIPFAGLTLIGGAAILGGIVVVLFAQAMPAVTMPGAMIRAMLAAYRRTLQKTMAQSRSMQQVVDEAGLDWLDTPDQAVVWGTALGLQGEIEGVLARSLEDVQRGQTSGFVPYFPIWYQNSSGAPFMDASSAGSGGSLFSDSGIPDVGGMMSALGTIGNSPSSSGGGSGGGGFSGGGSGGGGGGSGGGF